MSNTTIQVYWNNNPTPINNETAFEVYRSTTPGKNYSLVNVIPADSLSFIDQNLLPNTTYYYIVRAINNNGAAPVSNEAFASTKSDTQLPTAPAYLTVTQITRHSVALTWNPSTDDVGISKYDIYVNGQKAFTTPLTQFTVNNLDSFVTYSFYVRARDFSNNMSVPSNQVSAFTKAIGISYQYYEGSWTVLPNFNTLTPIKSGYSSNVDITLRNQNTNYAFLWQGWIQIPVTGTYTFETGSDDGSKLYIGNYSPTATALVNNDGQHGTTIVGGTITLNAGLYPIAITYFQAAGGQAMNVYWTCAAAGFPGRTIIPNSYFGDPNTGISATPLMPSNLFALPISYNKVHLTWNDNSTNETSFELYRKASFEPDFTMIALLPSNTTMYDDTTVIGSTTYSYKLQSVNLYGSSGFNPVDLGGVQYSYYQGTWTSLPDFTTITPIASGVLSNFSLAPMQQPNYFAFKFFTNINISVAGAYTFFTTSDDGSKLYLNTFDAAGQVVNNDNIHSAIEKSGSVTLTAGTHPMWVTYFQNTSSSTLQVRYQGPGIAKVLIPDSVFVNKNTTITTPPLPAPPLVPAYLTVQAVSPYLINVSFKDSSNQTGYEVYRSAGTPNSFHLFKTYNLTDSSISFADNGLYANTSYYYQVRAFGVGGFSAYSPVVSAVTLDNAPKLTPIVSFAIYNMASNSVPVKATDIDGDNLSFTFRNLPSFASFSNTGNGTGNLLLNPTPALNGTYNMTIIVDDGKGGKDSTVFSITVNNNQPPVMYRLRDFTIQEGSVNLTSMTASDPDKRTILRWTLTNGPAFLSIRVTSNSTASLYSAPGYADAGVYPFTVTVSDGSGGVVSSSAIVTVLNVETSIDDGTIPITPGNLTAQSLPNGSVQLGWKDIAYNESAYLVYRALSAAGPYSLLNPSAVNPNDTTYVDNTAAGNILYYYQVTAINTHGNSAPSNTVNITTINKLPVLQTINNVVINSGSQPVLNIHATDDPGETLTINATGLPSFASIQNTGNGLATITFQPQLNDVGVYNNVTIQVSDNFGGTTTQQFSVNVMDSSFRSIFVNFSSQGGTIAPSPWNNYSSFPFASFTLNNLLDAFGVNTGYNVRFLQQLTGNYNTGMTANDKGIYPDSVLLTSVYYSGSSTQQMEFGGLNPAKKYNVVLMSSYNSGDDGTATFMSGTQSVTLNAMYNTTKSVQLNGLVPNTSGIIDVSFTKSAAALNVYINAVVLQEYSGIRLIRPADLFTETVLASDKIKLTWSDRSDNETGFEIWRSTSPTGPFALITTTTPNVTTYTNTGLTPNVTYYYEVRAVMNSTYSAFSNISGISLPSQIVYLNWDINYHAPAPWNSTDAPPVAGATFSNLQDTSMNNTGYEMLIISGFNGEFYAGVTGGGIFPDNVMQSNYWTDASQVSQVKFSNLDERKLYRIGCFGSATWYGFFNGNYTINGQTLSFNSHNNNSKVIYFVDVRPNSDGEIYLNISPAAGVPYCFTGAITIESYDPGPGYAGPIAGYGQPNNFIQQPGNIADVRSANRNENVITSVKAYPNPFVNDLKVDLALASKVKHVSLMLYDVNGRMVYTKVLGSNEVSTQRQILDLSMTRALPAGNYFLRVICDGQSQQTIKLVKAR
ncbi:MAG: PA14 domain-containing protein [Bacteroidota bacterium]|nr:PA14 domain-containing protein [Bacteroidota bacterium]